MDVGDGEELIFWIRPPRNITLVCDATRGSAFGTTAWGCAAALYYSLETPVFDMASGDLVDADGAYACLWFVLALEVVPMSVVLLWLRDTLIPLVCDAVESQDGVCSLCCGQGLC